MRSLLLTFAAATLLFAGGARATTLRLLDRPLRPALGAAARSGGDLEQPPRWRRTAGSVILIAGGTVVAGMGAYVIYLGETQTSHSSELGRDIAVGVVGIPVLLIGIATVITGIVFLPPSSGGGGDVGTPDARPLSPPRNHPARGAWLPLGWATTF